MFLSWASDTICERTDLGVVLPVGLFGLLMTMSWGVVLVVVR